MESAMMTYPTNHEPGFPPVSPPPKERSVIRILAAIWTVFMFIMIGMGIAANGSPRGDAETLGALFGIGFLLFIWMGGMAALALLKFLFKK
jgi:hypothetical protein